MKGRPQAAHFAAFPRPPNYRSRNPNAHTNIKEKKLKRILTSVFLVLAVIATVGIFGIQTSDRTEAQTPGVTIHPTVNDGNGVPDIHVELGTSVTIDLADYVQAASSTAASDIDYFLVAANVRTGSGTTQNPYVYSRQIYDPDAVSQVAPNAPRWLASIATATLNGSELTINPVALGAARRVHWVADTRADTARDATDASEYETYDRTVAETGGTNSRFTVDPKDDFSITVVAAGTVPDADDFPTTATSGVGADGMAATGAAATFAATALSSNDDGDDAVSTAGETAAIPVVWTVDNTALSTAYRLVAPASPSGIVNVVTTGSTGVITITPVSQGTVSIGPIYAVHHAWEDNPADAPAALREKLSDAVTFTVHYATNAPPVRIFKDIGDDGTMDATDPTGGADDPIEFDITTADTGKIGELKSHAGAAYTYTNRNMTWRLVSANGANGANVASNFRIDRSGPELLGKISVGSIVVREALDEGTYTVRVIAQDAVPPADGPPEVAKGNQHSVDVTIRVSQANRPPVISQIPASVAIPEVTTKVGDTILDLETVTSDPDNQGLAFTLVAKSGQTPAENLGGKVEIASGSSEITLVETVNYEDVDDDGATDDEDTAAEQPAGYDRDAVRWRGTLTISDGFVTLEKKIAFTVMNEDEAATTTTATGVEFSIDENNTVGAVLGNVRIPESAAAGADDATTGYSLVGDAATGKFALSTDGELTATAVLDHEETAQYRLTATVSNNIALVRSVTVTVNDVNEPPVLNNGATPTPVALAAGAGYVARVSESADTGSAVAYGVRTDDPPQPSTYAVARGASDIDDGDVLSYSLVAAQTTTGNPITDPEVAFSGPFTINGTTGEITVSGDLDAEETPSYTLYVKVSDDDATTRLSDTAKLTITVTDANELPFFVTTSGGTTRLDEVEPIVVNENTASPTELTTYHGYDPDGNDFEFVLRTSLDSDFFSLVPIQGNASSIRLTPKAARTLDYETKATYQVEIEIVDSQGSQNQILQTINLRNLNDNAPVWQDGYTSGDHANNRLSVDENTLRGRLLATYLATDADGDLNPLRYTLSGVNGSQYQLDSANAMLKTLASLDADGVSRTHNVAVTVSDGTNSRTRDVRISIDDVDDRIGSITVKMANPVMGTNGDPNTALSDRKTTASNTWAEAPADLPATRGAPANESVPIEKFVETSSARWGSVLRIEVLAESPDRSAQSAGGERCGNGNQCVVITLEGDDSADVLKVMAFRNYEVDNLFVAAVMPVRSSTMATDGTAAVYKHGDGGVPRIHVDEEDTLRIKFGNLRDSVTIDNEAPEFSNFLPEHEASTDDEEVQYTFTVTDAISGIPDPEDLPDVDGDENYMAVAVLVHNAQCHNVTAAAEASGNAPSGTIRVPDTNLYDGSQIYCPPGPGDPPTEPEQRSIADDKDLDSVTDGYEVDTEVVLTANQISYVTFIACDAAGNCAAFDPDENDLAEALAEITVDTRKPDLVQARTGVMWDAADNKYDDSRSFIQAIFDDLSKLNPDTIEADDFVVDGYTIKRVYWYDDPDTGDENWGTRYDTRSGSLVPAYIEISKTVFIELEEDLLPDATPDVSVVPNGLEDEAGKEQDDDEVEADDWIAPNFAVQSITSPRETSRDNVLVGEDEKVTITVTSDERINTTKPLVDVDYVNAPAGCVDRAGIILRDGRDTDGDGRLEPGEARADCARNATGTPLNSVISKDGTNEWTITVDKPSATGYYNVYIHADDRSSQNNRGSEGVNPDEIVTKFFEKDGDVNADDAVYFEGDVQLPKPQVVVSGEQAGDTDPTVEFKRPLFIEVDFTEPFSADCSAGDKLSNKLECTAESAEYAEDGFDAVTITRFELDGVDMTDDVKTTDDETFLIALDDVSIGDHELKIQATDLAGNELNDVLEIEFEVEERDPFTRRLNPGWNLVSLPGSPADSAIASVFGSDIEVRTVYTYNPVTPGGWQVAVRETLDDAWQGDLTDITAKSGYWVLSDAIQDLEISIPRLAGGAVGASTPVQPPVIPMYAGWNLIPVVDVTGDALDTKKSINATTYLNSLDDGLDLARVLGFNTITNEWFTVIDPSDASVTDNLQIGSAYWVFVRESASLVPGGIPR